MTRQVILDTETTGLDHRTGDRVVEIGCVELLGRKLTGQRFHVYLNPERQVGDSQRIHGLSDDFLADKPKFASIVNEFRTFVSGSELIIHNADFDVGFLNSELARLGSGPLAESCTGILDTLKEARKLRPGKKNSLDALCNEYGVDNSGRQLHGALLDAELLAEVYLAMTRGQNSLEMDFGVSALQPMVRLGRPREALRVLRASEAELADHHSVLGGIAKESKGQCVWLEIEPESAA